MDALFARTRSLLIALLSAIVLTVTPAAHGFAQEATPIAVRQPYTPGVELSTLTGQVIVDGSSTVYPITDEAALRFRELADDIEIEVAYSGTGAGFTKFCNGETDLQNASRAIEADEMAACAAAGVSYYAFMVGFDGITIVVNRSIDFVSCLTVDQLSRLWSPDSTVKTWRDLDPAWPDDEIELYGPGPASGTFDYFTAAIVGDEGVSRTDYFPSENDLDLVIGVEESDNGLGYFGFSYFEDHQDTLRAVAVDAGAGCVIPSRETIAAGTYAPLSRPLLIYVNAERLASPDVREFLRYYLANAPEIVTDVKAVPAPDEAYAAGQIRLEQAIAGALAPDGPN